MELRINILPAIMSAKATANLGADEDVAEPAAANRRSSRVGLERRGECGAGAFERRGESEQNAGGKRDGKDVGKDSEVGVHVENQRAILGREGFGGHRSPIPSSGSN